MSQPETTLTVVIPAYNEEGAIEQIIQRCLVAKEGLLAETDLEEVEVIVVSDGSTDQTVPLAQPYADRGEIRLIAYVPNAGYGAALKLGFKEGQGGLVSFLDADGTCDPVALGALTNSVLRDGHDVACGCRMNPRSKMPAVRKLGNWIFCRIINFLAQAKLRDSASGMRVIRRSSLEKLYPLPDGLHFTPAMSCRAMLDDRIKLSEIDIDYEERIGRSKLNVVTDGLRFLRVILDTGLTYRPFRLFGPAAFGLFLLALGLGLSIAWSKWGSPSHAHLPRWYLIRMLTSLTAASGALSLATLGLVAERIAVLVQEHQPREGLLHRLLLPLLGNERITWVGLLLVLAALVLNIGTAREWITTGHIRIDLWWSYITTGAFCAVTGFQLASCGILVRVIKLLEARQRSPELVEVRSEQAS